MKFPASVRISDLTTDDAESDSDDSDRDDDDDDSNAEDGEQGKEVRAYSFSCHHRVEKILFRPEHKDKRQESSRNCDK